MRWNLSFQCYHDYCCMQKFKNFSLGTEVEKLVQSAE